jgi:hypothetical protein
VFLFAEEVSETWTSLSDFHLQAHRWREINRGENRAKQGEKIRIFRRRAPETVRFAHFWGESQTAA